MTTDSTSMPQPGPSLERAIRAGYITYAAAGAGFVLAPNNLLLSATLAAIAWGGIAWSRRQLNGIKLVDDGLAQKRTLPLAKGIPFRRDEHQRIVASAEKPFWEPDGICFVRHKVNERIRHATHVEDLPWYRDVVEVEHEPVYRRQDGWLKEKHPERHNLVMFWWLSGFVVPALIRRFPTYEFKLDTIEPSSNAGSQPSHVCLARKREEGGDPDRPWERADGTWCQEIASDYRRWRYEGVLLALCPKRWTRRVDRRPSSRPLSFLHHALLDLYSGRPTEGDAPLPDDHRVRFAVQDDMYVGDGFEWQVSHIKALHELYGKDTPTNSDVDGDPRIYGVGAAKAGPVFLPMKSFNTHLRLLGAPGSGKTRELAIMTSQVVRAGKSLVLVDPKLDRDSVNMIIHEARRHGRGNRVHVFHLSAPRCREVSSYNPLFVYDMADELASRVAGVVERTSDPFWHKVGVSSARAVLKLCDALLRFLGILGVRQLDGSWQLSERFHDTPPPVLLGLTWAMHNPKASTSAIVAAVDRFLANRRDSRWQPDPTNVAEVAMLEMCSLPFWSCRGWNPTFKPVNAFGVAAPEIIVAWAIRVVYNHIWLDDRYRAERSPKQPERLQIDMAVDAPSGQGGQVRPDNWWHRYKDQHTHPLELILRLASMPEDQRQAAIPKDMQRTVEIYQAFLPVEAFQNERIRDLTTALLEQMPGAMSGMRGKAVQNRGEYTKHMTTLASSLDLFDTERDRLINALDPDIILRDAIHNGDIVLFLMNSMKDGAAAEGFARTIVADCLGHLGETYGVSAKGRYEFFLILDEYGQFANEQMTKILSMGRGAGVSAICAGQGGSDTIVAIGDVNRAHQIDDNLTMKAMLRTASMRDAKEFSENVGRRSIELNGGRSLTTNPNYGDHGNKQVGSFNQTENRSWQDKDMDVIPPTALTQLPTFQSFFLTQAHLYLTLGGLLPPVGTNVLEEFGILKYEDGSKDSEYATRRFRELDLTANSLEAAIASPAFAESATRTQISLRGRYPQDRDRDAVGTSLRTVNNIDQVRRASGGQNQAIGRLDHGPTDMQITGGPDLHPDHQVEERRPSEAPSGTVAPPAATAPAAVATGAAQAAPWIKTEAELRARAKAEVERLVGHPLPGSSASRPAVSAGAAQDDFQISSGGGEVLSGAASAAIVGQDQVEPSPAGADLEVVDPRAETPPSAGHDAGDDLVIGGGRAPEPP